LTSILAKERDGTVNKLPTFDIQNWKFSVYNK
jgi:hypothetical protein